MKTPAPPSRSLEDLRELTPARVGLGRAGASMPTDALLAFTLDHARARDAVHTAFDAPQLVAGLAGLGLQAGQVSSQARQPARLSAPSRPRAHAGSGFAARAGRAERRRERACRS